MPPGLVELIEGLTREVLKNNPSDIYGFCAGHLQQLLETRDGPRKLHVFSTTIIFGSTYKDLGFDMESDRKRRTGKGRVLS